MPHPWASLPVMGVLPNPIYAREALLPMSVRPKGVREIYVPFVEGTFNGLAFRATLQPDGQGGHWLKVDRKLREAAGAEAGDVVSLEIAPVAEEPEPRVPADLRKALAAAYPKARAVWSDITPVARRDWIQWIESAKREETRLKRIESACDMLTQGKRCPCCFDRSGTYAKSLSCPVADDTSSDTRR